MPKNNNPKNSRLNNRKKLDQSDLLYPEDMLPEEQGLEDADWLPGGAEDFVIPQGLLRRMIKKAVSKAGVRGGQKKALDSLLKRGKPKKEPVNITEHETLDYGKMEKARKAGLDKPEHVIEYTKDRLGRQIPKKPRKIEYPED